MNYKDTAVSEYPYSIKIVEVLFFFSGFCALGYQVSWQRILTTFFGVQIYSTSTVVFTFMIGLGLGALVILPFLRRVRNLIAFYGLIELFIGLIAILSPWLLTTVGNIALPWLRHNFVEQGIYFYLTLLALYFLLLIVPTLLMGTTLPVLCQALKKNYENVGHVTGRLYAINTFGATIGCLVTGFLIIGIAGLNNTLLLYGILNIIVGIIAIILSKGSENLIVQEDPLNISHNVSGKSSPIWHFLILYGLTGFIALGYEMLYFRFVGTLLGNSTYVFSTILFVYLVGIAAGGIAYNKWRLFPKFLLTERFCLMHLILGVCSFISVICFMWFSDFELGRVVFGKYLQKGFFRPNLLEITALFLPPIIFIFIPTFIMGYMFPLFNEIITKEQSKVGINVSLAYFANIVGAGIGVLLVTFVMLPFLKTEGTFLFLIVANLSFPFFYYLSRFEVKKVGAKFIIISILILIVFITFPRHPKIYKAYFLDNVSWAYIKEGITGVAALKKINYPNAYIENAKMFAGLLYQNGGWVTPILKNPSVILTELLVHSTPHEILNIGLSQGMTSYYYLKDKRVKSLTTVELSEELDDAVKQLPHLISDGDKYMPMFKDPRFNYQTNDGRFWLMYSEKSFDIINTITLGYYSSHNGNLSSINFFKLCRQRLKQGGIVIMYDYQNPIIVKTFLQVFPNVIKSGSAYLGSVTPFEINVPKIKKILAGQGAINIQEAFNSFLCELRSRHQIENSPLIKGLPVNTDLSPISEYYLTSPILEPTNVQPPFNLNSLEHILIDLSDKDKKTLPCLNLKS